MQDTVLHRTRTGAHKVRPVCVWTEPDEVTSEAIRAQNAMANSAHAIPGYLLRQSLAIVFCPVTIRCHCFHGRSAIRSASARPFHLRFGHAEAGLRLQTRADVDHVAFVLLRGAGA